MSYLSVSTWSLHRHLGPMRLTEWDGNERTHRVREVPQPQLLTLLELPAEAAKRGYRALEICHFHFPSVDEAYLLQLKDACAKAGVSFDTLLLDYGDLTSPDSARREADLALMKRWIDAAATAGADRVRIVAGEAEPGDEDAIGLSARLLNELGRYAEERGVRIVTENFKSLTSTGASCSRLLERLDDRIGMITDFGNFKPPAKYDEFGLILPRSLSVHAKPFYDEGGIPDAEELRRCLNCVEAAGYDGAVVLIYDGPGDMWEGLDRVKALVEPSL
ncbi:sugar phosphate isomerase/epimerase family protein [Cohnella zeiphila]|uniref:Sugar phosphate isomerase/epimerase n=1 Tax=Cohnella zeiphila TaxID=2761120 RepID=A0A7X0SP78_9BACL|nr:sugar phosphate isomerase/epimerase family protein [Cohnella zeiphila]MBB6733561.1 sugar phosphate isomerase/epimerase [Cohnella zeiphila]